MSHSKILHDGHHPLTKYILKVFILLVALSLILMLFQLAFQESFSTVKISGSSGWKLIFFRSTANSLDKDVSKEDLACQVMHVDPYKKSVLKLSRLEQKPLNCTGYMPDITFVEKLSLKINKTKAKEIKDFQFCKYREIFRDPESDHEVVFGNWSQPFTSRIDLPESTEFIIVLCENNASQIVTKTYHALIPKRDHLAELDSLKIKKREIEAGPSETLNVIMIGMDGTSRHQMMRGMNKTYTYLMEELHSFDMTMYNQLGINTFPNYLPLLTGFTEDEVRQWWHRSKHLDPLDTIWKDFANAGYRTLYTEDYPSIGGFHYSKQGFLFPPTMYYSHPICVAMEKDYDIWRSGKHCVGNTPEVNFHFDYIIRFLRTFIDTPVFATSFFTKLTHDDMTNNKKVDMHTYNFYKYLADSGYLNNTLLITFSDHGPRWGAIRTEINGMIESRAPYALFTFPPWFLTRYPDVVKYLKVNSKRLTTHFDTHATLRDILYFKAKGRIPLIQRNYGISLFQEIPKNRTCADIAIPMEFCLCDQHTMEGLSSNSNLSLGLADIVVNSVNSKRNETMCKKLKLKKIISLILVKLPTLVSKNKRFFKIKVQTEPGEAVYEATVQTTFHEDDDVIEFMEKLKSGNASVSKQLIVGESIDRLTLYKSQADCEPDASKKPYCYCI